MAFVLRPYQKRAADKIMEWVRASVEPCLLDAATGAGKSLIVADVAARLHKISGGKRVLCLAPSAELVTQNREKYLATGEPCSVFSASAGGKSTRHPVVFGSPQTVVRNLSRFQSGYCAVILDEAHGITPTVQSIIGHMRAHNPNLRVIGMSATCYRLGDGYIYRIDERGRTVPETQAREPYFAKLVDRITPYELIAQGYLTPPTVGSPLASGYDASALRPNTKWRSADIDAAFVGRGRKTAAIVADVVAQAQGRMGVMFFAATVQHAAEIMESLPPGLSACVTGKTSPGERARIIAAFKALKVKYIVNVSVLTTGFDAPHVDVIALLRKTESVGLLQQIIGRGLRLHPDKSECLILDYAGNIEAHCPDGDVFDPEIRAAGAGGSGEGITCTCPDCGGENVYSARPNPDGFAWDDAGYFVDLAGNTIETDAGPTPAHYGRRCMHLLPVGGGRLEQCQYRYTSKDCPACGHANDIAARYCSECKAEIVDPNEKLQVEFKALKRSPYNRQCDEVISCEVRESVSAKGNETVRLDFKTPYRSFSVWLMKNPTNNTAAAALDMWRALGGHLPKTVEYQKEESGFFRVFSYNREADVDPT